MSYSLEKEDWYFVFVLLLAACIPVSTFGMSVCQFMIVFYFIFTGDFRVKWKIIKTNTALHIFLIIYLVHLLGLIYTSSQGFGSNGYNALRDLRIKLPLIILPVLFACLPPFNFRQLKWIIYFFSLSLWISSIISVLVLYGFTPVEISEIREISLFTSHIRMSLFVNTSIFMGGFLLMEESHRLSPIERRIIALGLSWFLFFLFVLKAFTGIIIFVVMLGLSLLYWLWNANTVRWKLFFIAVLVVLSLGGAYYFVTLVKDYQRFDSIDLSQMDTHTINGRPYTHNLENMQVENQHWVGLYYNEFELQKEWNKRSAYPYDGKDDRGNNIRQTMERYLTSLDLRKDSLGVNSLSDQDVAMIEKGYANHIYKKKYSLYPRIYEIIWEVDLYFRGADPSGHSVAQRMEYFRIGLNIIKENFWIGVGTGDVQQSYNEVYQNRGSQLKKPFQRRAHNQYLSFLIAFGFLGFIFIVTAIVLPVFLLNKHKQALFLIPFFIALISMINEDTLETQAGVTFFVFFYALFLFAYQDKGFEDKSQSIRMLFRRFLPI